ncbi:MAG: hypothetical protein M3141_02605, partial [Actinomycetota bacterium]|nr:hypothetical protein [Actinomycetota bacterium]
MADECRFYAEQLLRWTGIDLRRTKQFGTAAIAEGPGPRRGPYTNHTAIFVLDWDGRYRFWGTNASDPQIGTQPKPGVDFQATADAFVEAVRDRDCAAFVRVTMPGGDFYRGTRNTREACDTVFRGRNLAPQLRADPGVEPEPLGETLDLGFFGIATKRNHYTLIVGTRPTD